MTQINTKGYLHEIAFCVSKKYLGLCPKPHLRDFFEKKSLKNPQKTLEMGHIVGFRSTNERKNTFIDRLKGLFEKKSLKNPQKTFK